MTISKPFRVQNDIRIVEFEDSRPEDALALAAIWLQQLDGKGERQNSFYFLSAHLDYVDEIGWVCQVVCGNEHG